MHKTILILYTDLFWRRSERNGTGSDVERSNKSRQQPQAVKEPRRPMSLPGQQDLRLSKSKTHHNGTWYNKAWRTRKAQLNPLISTLKPQSNGPSYSNGLQWLVHWPLMGGLLHLVQRGGTGRGRSPPRPLLAVPNVTAHPATASVPTSYCSTWPLASLGLSNETSLNTTNIRYSLTMYFTFFRFL